MTARSLADPAATERFGARLGALLGVGDVIALSGGLGAGKTTLSRGLLAGLGFAGEVPSPSFPLVIEYRPPELRLPLWHVDLYRVTGPEELEELGLDDARSDAALVVEWPERLGDRLWPDSLLLDLAPAGDGRTLTAGVPAAWQRRWQQL